MSVGDFYRILVALEVTRGLMFCNLASYTMLLYDYFLTLGSEIEFIWPAPWSLGKVLFFCTRYPALVDGALLTYLHNGPPSTPLDICTKLYKASGWMIVLGVLVAELILIFRTWAIWGRNNKIATMLLCFGCLLIIPVVIFAYEGFDEVRFGRLPNALSTTCWESKNPSQTLYIDYIAIIVFESVILALTIYKGVQHLRYSRSSLVMTLYRDGVLFYVYLIGFSLVNIVILVLAPKPGPNLLLMQRDLHSIFTGRLLLNLREAACRDRMQQISMGSYVTDFGATGDEVENSRARTAFSSVIIGVDTWFREGLV